ncbi:O-fucosyltransferase 36-like isoform X2 [Coffea arabica]|uniref:O-fucosyltransferase 36-like isoform X2 n=1 Tax=Coffea arabica TaxID=13443 RepID=A0ABM4U1X0_COFAR
MMESQSSSSDEEDDRQHLIEQNERRGLPHSPSKSPRHSSSAFQIDFPRLPNSRSTSVASFFNNKRYLFAVFLPLLLLLLYFTTDIRNLFHTTTPISNLLYDSSSLNRMRQSELHALYLLKQQQLGLFTLWNRTTLLPHNPLNFSVNPTNASSNVVDSLPSSSPARLEDLKSDLLRHISLNKQIQQVLLSSHRLGDPLDSLSSNTSTDPTLGAGFDGCRKVEQGPSSQRRTIDWNPKSNKYLFAMCVSGQMSNHLICLEKHMFFAAALNRVLVIPSSKVDYEFHRVLDIDHINKCLGRKVVVTFEEFAASRKNRPRIDKFLCYFSSPQPCFMDDERVKKLKSLGVSLPKLESAWTDDVKNPKQRTIQDVLSKFSTDDDVIAIGDVFFADVEREWVTQPGGPIAHKCKTLIEPSRFILLTAQRFVQTFLGRDFIALHFRRHGFLKFWISVELFVWESVPLSRLSLLASLSYLGEIELEGAFFWFLE